MAHTLLLWCVRYTLLLWDGDCKRVLAMMLRIHVWSHWIVDSLSYIDIWYVDDMSGTVRNERCGKRSADRENKSTRSFVGQNEEKKTPPPSCDINYLSSKPIVASCVALLCGRMTTSRLLPLSWLLMGMWLPPDEPCYLTSSIAWASTSNTHEHSAERRQISKGKPKSKEEISTCATFYSLYQLCCLSDNMQHELSNTWYLVLNNVS